MKRSEKISNICLVAFALLLAAAGAVRTLFFEKDINTYENRYAEKVDEFSVEGYMDGKFQESVESALQDQIPFSQYGKKLYNDTNGSLINLFASGLYKKKPMRYSSIGNMKVFGGDYLVYDTRRLEDMTPALDKKIENVNGVIASHPELDIYMYYIEKDTDINFETNEKVYAYEYIKAALDLPEGHTAKLAIDSFEDYSRKFYRTDHHWNCEGSYEGYVQVAGLLGIEDVIIPVEKVDTGYVLSGSKAMESGNQAVFTEPFSAYRFELPDMSITINGVASDDYGNQEAYLSGTAQDEISYGNFYGGDHGEIIFDTGTQGRGNLLVIGESHDNAILKLLAAGFDRTYSIDLRNYQAQCGKQFRLSEYIETNDIDKLLLIGSIGFYTSEEMMLEE